MGGGTVRTLELVEGDERIEAVELLPPDAPPHREPLADHPPLALQRPRHRPRPPHRPPAAGDDVPLAAAFVGGGGHRRVVGDDEDVDGGLRRRRRRGGHWRWREGGDAGGGRHGRQCVAMCG
jgi:hypothetical protein